MPKERATSEWWDDNLGGEIMGGEGKAKQVSEWDDAPKSTGKSKQASEWDDPPTKSKSKSKQVSEWDIDDEPKAKQQSAVSNEARLTITLCCVLTFMFTVLTTNDSQWDDEPKAKQQSEWDDAPVKQKQQSEV